MYKSMTLPFNVFQEGCLNTSALRISPSCSTIDLPFTNNQLFPLLVDYRAGRKHMDAGEVNEGMEGEAVCRWVVSPLLPMHRCERISRLKPSQKERKEKIQALGLALEIRANANPPSPPTCTCLCVCTHANT